MKKLIQTNFLVLALLWCCSVGATPNDKKAKPTKPKAESFVISVNGEEVGSAKLRISVSEKGRYASWKLAAKNKSFVPSWAIHQKRSDGSLLKYQRLEDKRLGAGVIAFSKGNMVRVVGKNQKRTPIEIETAYHGLWDPKTWLSVWDWPRRLGKAGDSVRMAYYNVETGKPGAMEGSRSSVTVYKLKDATVLEVTKWVMTGLGQRPLTVYVTALGKLVYLTDGERALLRSGISLTPPPPAEEPATEGEAVDAPPKAPVKPDGAEG